MEWPEKESREGGKRMGEDGEERERRDFKKKYLFCIWLFDFQIPRKVKNVKRNLCGWPHLPFSGGTLWVRAVILMEAQCSGTLEPHFLSVHLSLTMP